MKSLDQTTHSDSIFDLITSNGGNLPQSPFLRWHYKIKFEVMQKLFAQYLFSGCKFIDIGCGDGDAFIIAKNCQPDCELWGVDINQQFLDRAAKRVPDVNLIHGDMLNLNMLPDDEFDVVHEYGSSCLLTGENVLSRLANQYLRILKPGGILLWELPLKWSAAYLTYLFTVAPKNTAKDTKTRRIIRSFNPNKYSFFKFEEITEALNSSGYGSEIIEKVNLWHFFCKGSIRSVLDKFYSHNADDLFYKLDSLNKKLLKNTSGIYLVIKRDI